jgi:hypothetical protein
MAACISGVLPCSSAIDASAPRAMSNWTTFTVAGAVGRTEGLQAVPDTATFSGVSLPANKNGLRADMPASRNARTSSRSVSPIAL